MSPISPHADQGIILQIMGAKGTAIVESTLEGVTLAASGVLTQLMNTRAKRDPGPMVVNQNYRS